MHRREQYEDGLRDVNGVEHALQYPMTHGVGGPFLHRHSGQTLFFRSRWGTHLPPHHSHVCTGVGVTGRTWANLRHGWHRRFPAGRLVDEDHSSLPQSAHGVSGTLATSGPPGVSARARAVPAAPGSLFDSHKWTYAEQMCRSEGFRGIPHPVTRSKCSGCSRVVFVLRSELEPCRCRFGRL